MTKRSTRKKQSGGIGCGTCKSKLIYGGKSKKRMQRSKRFKKIKKRGGKSKKHHCKQKGGWWWSNSRPAHLKKGQESQNQDYVLDAHTTDKDYNIQKASKDWCDEEWNRDTNTRTYTGPVDDSQYNKNLCWRKSYDMAKRAGCTKQMPSETCKHLINKRAIRRKSNATTMGQTKKKTWWSTPKSLFGTRRTQAPTSPLEAAAKLHCRNKPELKTVQQINECMNNYKKNPQGHSEVKPMVKDINTETGKLISVSE